MKNQYFGDVNDYRKYGLLRLLTGPGGNIREEFDSPQHRLEFAHLYAWRRKAEHQEEHCCTGRFGGNYRP
jgi:hypothetical protein